MAGNVKTDRNKDFEKRIRIYAELVKNTGKNKDNGGTGSEQK